MADATSLTEAGYVGEDVENILLQALSGRRLRRQARREGASSASTRRQDRAQEREPVDHARRQPQTPTDSAVFPNPSATGAPASFCRPSSDRHNPRRARRTGVTPHPRRTAQRARASVPEDHEHGRRRPDLHQRGARGLRSICNWSRALRHGGSVLGTNRFCS